MSIYLTKSMLSSLNNWSYEPPKSNKEDESTDDHWKILESKKDLSLANDMICRVCAKNGCTPILESIGDYDIISGIRIIGNISISIDDNLPKYICTVCLESLNAALAFRKKCEISDKRFQNLIYPLGGKLTNSYPYSKHDFHLILHHMKLKRKKVEEKKQKQMLKRERLLKKFKASKIVKTFKCTSCDINFSDKEKLLEHRREKQCMKRACEICGQLVLNITQHTRHVHKQNSHECPTCGKEFPIIARLKNHMLVHSNKFNFFCDLCPYKSKHKYYLVMHMRTHTGEKPYSCALCPATFVNPSNLNKHKLKHVEKQFKCALCEKAFRTKSALREHHDATHMNIKHSCSFCGRDFCYKSDLRKHEIRYHDRIKRDYVGGEPTYKQVERLQKMQDNTNMDNKYIDCKWPQQSVALPPPAPVPEPIVHNTYIDPSKQYVPSNQVLYFSEVPMMSQHNPLVTQQTITLLPEMSDMKKNEVKVYECQSGINYF